MKTGSRLWISSDEISMNIEPNPNAQMPVGKARIVPGAPAGAWEFFEGAGVMRDECSFRLVDHLDGLILDFLGNLNQYWILR